MMVMMPAWILGCQPARHIEAPPLDRVPETTVPAQALRFYLEGMIHLNKGETELARVAFERARLFDADSPDVVAGLASTALLEDDWGRAKALARDALEMDASCAAAWLVLVQVGLETEGAGSARTILQEGLVQAPSDPTLLHRLGQLEEEP